MTLEYFANIAEIVGVVLVVMTLVFLTLQIRQHPGSSSNDNTVCHAV